MQETCTHNHVCLFWGSQRVSKPMCCACRHESKINLGINGKTSWNISQSCSLDTLTIPQHVWVRLSSFSPNSAQAPGSHVSLHENSARQRKRNIHHASLRCLWLWLVCARFDGGNPRPNTNGVMGNMPLLASTLCHRCAHRPAPKGRAARPPIDERAAPICGPCAASSLQALERRLSGLRATLSFE